MKSEIRQQMILTRNQMKSNLLKDKNDKIIKAILDDDYFQNAKCVGIYYPLKNEVNLLPLTNGKQSFAFPRVESDGIHFYLLDSKTSFKKSRFGVMEPQNGKRCDKDIDYLLTPALAITKDNYRIGFGKGYYDQFLSKTRSNHVLGVIYDFQEVEHFKNESHDQKLDGYFKG